MSDIKKRLEAAGLHVKKPNWQMQHDGLWHEAQTHVGSFVYGTDLNGQSYHHGPNTAKDHRTEEKARLAAEAEHERLVLAVLAGLIEFDRSAP